MAELETKTQKEEGKEEKSWADLEDEEEKKKEEEEKKTDKALEIAMEMLKSMDISNTENKDVSKYESALLDSSLLSKDTFESLKIPEDIIKTLYLLGYKVPSKIQQEAIPLIVEGKDIVCQSHSGSGKTIAFVVGTLLSIDLSVNKTQAIIISPTRELTSQIEHILSKFTKNTKFTSFLCLKEHASMEEVVDKQVVVGTPGTLKLLIHKGIVDGSEVKLVVLDEADALLSDDSIGSQTISALRKIKKKQVILFSATFNEDMKRVVSTLTRDPHLIYLEKSNLKPKNIGQFYMEVHDADKIKTLIKIYSLITVGQSIIFVATRGRAEFVQKTLSRDGFDASLLHGQLDAEERDRVIGQFKDGDVKVLVTTNVLSRGLDVPQLNLAVNYDIPRTVTGDPDYETYIHRIGRTGRFNRTGISIDFVSSPADLKTVISIEDKIGHKIKRLDLKSLETAVEKSL